MRLFLIFLPLAIPGLLLGQKYPSAKEAPAVSWTLPKGAKAEAYIGSQTCAVCHAEHQQEFGKTIHAVAAPASAAFGTGCESCHGPGKAHAEAMPDALGSPDKVAAAKKLIYGFHGSTKDNAARCLTCHNSSMDQRAFERSEHKMNGLTCSECHASHLVNATTKPGRSAQAKFFSVPELKEEKRWLSESLLRQKQPDLCFTCHKAIQAQFSLPTHHRVPEGLMKCTDCHDTHGTTQRPKLRKANFEACVGCHTEKRGPFLYEHAAAKVEGCTSCHSPHGTVERNMLLRREGRFLCLQCHVDPAATNVPHGRGGFTTRGECVRCHVAVHGSNVGPYLLQ
jgi:predicted CXXCH cytochrome family protein